MRYKTLFFDLDDTLVDTVQNNKEALLDIFNQYDLQKHIPSFDVFYDKFKTVNLELWEQYAHGKITKDYLKEARFTETLKDNSPLSVDESMKMNDDFLARASTKKNVIEGGKEILEYLYPKYNMYILSNGFKEVQSHKMNNAQLNPYFKKIILSDHIGKNKPHPDIFDYALKEADTVKSDVIMIGDNMGTDILGAKNSGIDQIWFNPQQSSDVDNIKPTYTISKLSELRNIL